MPSLRSPGFRVPRVQRRWRAAGAVQRWRAARSAAEAAMILAGLKASSEWFPAKERLYCRRLLQRRFLYRRDDCSAAGGLGYR